MSRPVNHRLISQVFNSKQPFLRRRSLQQITSRCFSHPTNSNCNTNTNTNTNTPVDPAVQVPNIFVRLQSRLEESSGLTALSVLKQQVQDASDRFDFATSTMATARQNVEAAQTAHDIAHKKHVSLLMRRDDWSPEDAQSFVNMTGVEVQTRRALLDAQSTLSRSETDALNRQHAYMDVMRQRYHEEQLWQDKWRLLGTYGTWSLIGINTIVFGVGQFYLERRERTRMNHLEESLRSFRSHSSNSNTNTNNNNNKDDDTKSTNDHQTATTATAAATATASASAESSVVGTDQRAVTQQQDERQSELITPKELKQTNSNRNHTGPETIRDPPALQQKWNAASSKLFLYWKETRQNLHAPSMALGAVVGTSCAMALSIVLANNKR